MRKLPGRRLLLKLLLAEAFGWPSGRNAAHALGVSENAISRIVSGRDTPSDRIVAQLEKILGVEREMILTTKLPKAWRV